MANSPTVFRDLQTSLERAGFKADIKQTNISEAEIRITKGNRAGNAIAMKLSVVESPVGPTFVIHLGSQQFLEAPDLVISSTSGNVNTDLQTSSMQLQARVAAAFSGGASRFGSTAQKAFSGSLREEGYGSHPAKILPTGASPTITESSFGAIHVTFRGEGGMGEPTLFMKGILSDYIADALGSVRASGLPIVTKPTTTGVGKPVTATWGDIAQWVPLWTKGDYLQKTTGIARTLGDRWEGIVPFTYERGGKSFSLAMGGTNNLLIPLMRRKGGGVPWQEMTAEELRGTPGEDVRYARGSLLAFNASTPEYFWRQNLLAAPIAGLPGGMLRPLGSRQPEEMGLRGTDIAKMPFTQLFTTPSGGTGVMEMLQSGQLKIRNIIGAKIGGGERITMARFTDEQGNTIPIFAGKTRSPAWTPSAEVWEIPKYVNPITGVFSASNKPGTREVTADEIKALTESSGVSVVTAEGIKTPRIRMEGWTHPNFGKWRDVIKGGGVESTERQNVQVGGQTIRIDEITEEFKSGVALHKILESRSPEQLEFLFQKYAAISKNPGAVEFANWYHENFVAVTTSPGQMRPAADINVLSAKLAEFTSGSKSTKYAAYLGGTGLELEQELFKRIIIPATAGSPENAELIKRFGMGRVPDTSENRIEAGRIHPHSIDILYQEALQRINDPTAAKRYMEENFEFQAPDGSVLSFEDALHYNVTSGQLPKMREHLGNAYLIIGMPESMPAEYQASRALIEASQAGFINSQFPKFWKAVTRPGDRQGFSQVDIALSSYMKFQSQYSEASEIYAVENKDYIAHLAAIQKRGQEAATTGDQEAYRAISEREAAFPSPGAELFHDIQMPTKYTEVTADAGHNISAWLTANSDKTVAEKMQYVSKVLSAMPGGIQGELLHFGSGFLPTPAIAERATYTDRITGKPIANISNLWLKAIQLMGSQAVDVANQNPTIEEINAMNRAQEGFYNEINKEISAHQGRYKGALSTLAVSGVSGRYAVSRLLGANEIYVPKSSLTRVLREMGFRGDELKTALAQAMGGENIQALGARVPSLPREEQTQAVTLVSYANMLKRVGSPSEIDALQKAKDIFYVSPWISKLGEGDLDYDQALFVLGFRKTENGKLQSVKTGEFLGKAAVTSADAMARMLQMGLQFEESPDKKIDIINKIIEMTSWKDITKLLKTSWRMTALKGPGAGSRYNLTRLISPIMMTGGASAEKVSTFYSTTQKIYTPGLDTWDTVRRMEQLGGRLVSAMTRGSIRTSAYGGTRLHYGSFKESSQYPGFVGIDIFAGEISGTPEEVMGKMEGIMSLAGMPLEMEKGSKHPEKYNEWMPKSLATIATFAEEDEKGLAQRLEKALNDSGQEGMGDVLREHLRGYFKGLTTLEEKSAMVRKLMVGVPIFASALVQAEIGSHYGSPEERAEKQALNEEFYTSAGFSDDQIEQIKANSTITRWLKGERGHNTEPVTADDLVRASAFVPEGELRERMKVLATKERLDLLPFRGAQSQIDSAKIQQMVGSNAALETGKGKRPARGVERRQRIEARLGYALEQANKTAQYVRQQIMRAPGTGGAANLEEALAQLSPGWAKDRVQEGLERALGFRDSEIGGDILSRIDKMMGGSPAAGESYVHKLANMAPAEREAIAASFSKQEVSRLTSIDADYKKVKLALAVYSKGGGGGEEGEKTLGELRMATGEGGMTPAVNLGRYIKSIQSKASLGEKPYHFTEDDKKIGDALVKIEKIRDAMDKVGDSAEGGSRKLSSMKKEMEGIAEPFGGLKAISKLGKQLGARMEQEGYGQIAAAAEGMLATGTAPPGAGRTFAAMAAGIGGGREGGGLGGVLRGLFGGFGMMYLGRVAGYLQQGAGGEGFAQQTGLLQNLEQAGGIYGATRPLNNYAQMVQNLQAVHGAGATPALAMQAYMATHPTIQSLGGAGVAGLGVLSALAWGGKEIAAGAVEGSALAGVGGFLQKAAIPAAIATFALSPLLQGWTLSQNPINAGFQSGLAMQAAGNYGMGANNTLGSALANIPAYAAMGFMSAQAQATGDYSKIRQATQAQQAISTASNAIRGGSVVKMPGGTPSGMDLSARADAILAQYPYLGQAAAGQVAAFSIMNPNIPLTANTVQTLGTQYGVGVNMQGSIAGLLGAGGMSSAAVLGVGGVSGMAGAIAGNWANANLPFTQAAQEQMGQAASFMQQLGMGVMAPGMMKGLAGQVTPQKPFYTQQQIDAATATAIQQLTRPTTTGYNTGTLAGWVGSMTDRGNLTNRRPATYTPEQLNQQVNQILSMQGMQGQIGATLGTGLQGMVTNISQLTGGQQQSILATVGQMNNGLLQGNQAMYAAFAQQTGMRSLAQGLGVSSIPSMYGGQIPVSMFGRTDVGVGGMPTGMAWGTSSLSNYTGVGMNQVTPTIFPNQGLAGTGFNMGATGGVLNQLLPNGMTTLQQQSALGQAQNIWGPQANWGKSFAQGGYGAFGSQMINAMTFGVKLPGAPITLANGQQISSVAGTQAVPFVQAQQQYQMSMASAGLQMTGALSTLAFNTGIGINQYNNINPQTGQPFNIGAQNYGFNTNGFSYQSAGGGAWGISDASRYLGYAQQQSGFQFQQRGLNLQAAQFAQSMGLQQAGISLGIAQGTEQYQYQRGLSEQQFGFGQTMYHEQARFLSGRERRLAEMQNKEAITVHGMEVGQAQKEFGFQKQSWALQEEQHKLQLKQFAENKKLQQDQLKAAENFFDVYKGLQEAQAELQKAEFIESNKLQQAAAGLAAQAATNMRDLANQEAKWSLAAQDNAAIWNSAQAGAFSALFSGTSKLQLAWGAFINRVSASLGGGILFTMPAEGNQAQTTDNSPHAMGGSIRAGDYVGEWGPERVVNMPRGGLGVLPAGAGGRGVIGHEGFATGSLLSQYMGRTVLGGVGGGGGGQNTPVNIYIGNERLASFVINAVTKEIHR